MKTNSFFRKRSTILWIGFVSFFSFQMFRIVWPYTSWEKDIDFLMTKQAVIYFDHYQVAFYTHIFSSLIVLFSGAFLFSTFFIKNYASLHRWIGKSYVALLLFVSAPSGMLMAFYANGGWMAKLSFLLLSPIWWWCTYQGYRTARRRDFGAHRRWMMRSYALTLSAISLRIYQMLGSTFFYIDPALQYVIISWLSWLGNLILVEYLIHRQSRKQQKLSRSYLPV